MNILLVNETIKSKYALIKKKIPVKNILKNLPTAVLPVRHVSKSY